MQETLNLIRIDTVEGAETPGDTEDERAEETDDDTAEEKVEKTVETGKKWRAVRGAATYSGTLKSQPNHHSHHQLLFMVFVCVQTGEIMTESN